MQHIFKYSCRPRSSFGRLACFWKQISVRLLGLKKCKIWPLWKNSDFHGLSGKWLDLSLAMAKKENVTPSDINLVFTYLSMTKKSLIKEAKMVNFGPETPSFRWLSFGQKSLRLKNKDEVKICLKKNSGVNFMSQQLRRIPPGGILVLTLIDSFLYFWAECMFTLKFWGNYYSAVEQNLLPGRKKGESCN